jgi:hypothetical protein
VGWTGEDRRAVAPSPVGHGLIVVGSTGMEHEELSVLPGEETVHYIILDVAEEDEEQVPELHAFTSVYHCILYCDRERTLLFSD